MKCTWCNKIAEAYCDKCQLGFCSDAMVDFDDEWDAENVKPTYFQFYDVEYTGHSDSCDVCLFDCPPVGCCPS